MIRWMHSHRRLDRGLFGSELVWRGQKLGIICSVAEVVRSGHHILSCIVSNTVHVLNWTSFMERTNFQMATEWPFEVYSLRDLFLSIYQDQREFQSATRRVGPALSRAAACPQLGALVTDDLGRPPVVLLCVRLLLRPSIAEPR